MTSITVAGPRITTTNCLGQDQFTVEQQPFVTAESSAGAVTSNATPGGGHVGSAGGLNDWSFDNLDEIVAVAIKAEFNTLDLVEMTNSMNDTEVKTSSAGGHGGHNPNNSSSTANNVQSTSRMGQQQQQPQLNERERERLDELYIASRSLVEPMEHERDVSHQHHRNELKQGKRSILAGKCTACLRAIFFEIFSSGESPK